MLKDDKNAQHEEMIWQYAVGVAHVKRALEVAWAGSHSVLLVGHPESYQRLETLRLDRPIITVSPCPCGCLGSAQDCVCTADERRLHKVRLAKHLSVADIIVETVCPRARDYAETGQQEPLAAVRTRVADAEQFRHPLPSMAQPARTLLSTAIDTLMLMPARVHRIEAVAATIAALDRKTEIASIHMTEAIQYGVLHLLC